MRQKLRRNQCPSQHLHKILSIHLPKCASPANSSLQPQSRMLQARNQIACRWPGIRSGQISMQIRFASSEWIFMRRPVLGRLIRCEGGCWVCPADYCQICGINMTQVCRKLGGRRRRVQAATAGRWWARRWQLASSAEQPVMRRVTQDGSWQVVLFHIIVGVSVHVPCTFSSQRASTHAVQHP